MLEREQYFHGEPINGLHNQNHKSQKTNNQKIQKEIVANIGKLAYFSFASLGWHHHKLYLI